MEAWKSWLRYSISIFHSATGIPFHGVVSVIIDGSGPPCNLISLAFSGDSWIPSKYEQLRMIDYSSFSDPCEYARRGLSPAAKW